MNRIIGLHGKKYAGKDTAALALIAQGYTPIAFADDLRALLYVINPIVRADNRGRVYRWQDVWDTEGYAVLKTLPEARRLMQVVATEGIRSRDPDFWVRQVEPKILAAGPEERWVITDVRFNNEAKMIRKLDGQVVEIVRPDTSGYDDHGADHSSEQGIDRGLIDYTLYNASTVEELHELIRNVAGV